MDADRRRSRHFRRVFAGVALVVLAASLTGCFSVLHAAQRAVDPEDMGSVDRPTSAPAPVSTIQPSAPTVAIAPGTVAANGIIRSPGQVFYGRVSVVATDTGGYDVRITDYRSPDGRPLFAIVTSTEVGADSTCNRQPETSNALPQLGELHSKSTTTFVLTTDASEFWRQDPTFLTNIVLIDPLKGTPGCLSAIAANARLVWDLPDMNPGFRTLDTGQVTGAEGQTHGNFQQLISYTVAEGDDLAKIAARFSITTNDLQWLNPNRTPNQLAELGETLNLARYLR